MFNKLAEAYKDYCQEAHNAISEFVEELNKANGRTDIVYLLAGFLYAFAPNKSECQEVQLRSLDGKERFLVLSESLILPCIKVKFTKYSIRSLCGQLEIGHPIKSKTAQDIIQAYVTLEKNSIGGCRGLLPVSAEAVREALLEYAIGKAVSTV